VTSPEEDSLLVSYNYYLSLLIKPYHMQWTSGLIRGVTCLEENNLHAFYYLCMVASLEGDNLLSVYGGLSWGRHFTICVWWPLLRETFYYLCMVASLEGDNLLVFYYISASEIWHNWVAYVSTVPKIVPLYEIEKLNYR
jgi:hypothetical protein